MFRKVRGFSWRASADLSIFPVRCRLTSFRNEEPSPRHSTVSSGIRRCLTYCQQIIPEVIFNLTQGLLIYRIEVMTKPWEETGLQPAPKGQIQLRMKLSGKRTRVWKTLEKQIAPTGQTLRVNLSGYRQGRHG